MRTLSSTRVFSYLAAAYFIKVIWFPVLEHHSCFLLESLITGTNKLNFKNIFITIYGSQEDYFNMIPLIDIIY